MRRVPEKHGAQTRWLVATGAAGQGKPGRSPVPLKLGETP